MQHFFAVSCCNYMHIITLKDYYSNFLVVISSVSLNIVHFVHLMTEQVLER